MLVIFGHFLELLLQALDEVVALHVDFERALSFHALLPGVGMLQYADLLLNEGANLLL